MSRPKQSAESGWVFHRSDPMGGAAGEAYANTLSSPGMRPEHVLAREAIQNSVDAATTDARKVHVRFLARQLSGKAKSEFADAARLSQVADRAGVLELPQPHCLDSLGERDKPISLLYVEDFGCEGLSGNPHDKTSNFYRLLLSLGDRTKARTSKGSGGSYGFGKSVYSSSSMIQTIFAYTRFKPAAGSAVSRLFGCGYYASHNFAGDSFSGRAWLGASETRDADGRVVVDPFEGEAADGMAQRLGFQLRDDSQTGTSILIVDASIDMNEVARGVEDWWWPRLVTNDLDIEIVGADGTSIPPRPMQRPDLRPFIASFNVAMGATPPVKGEQKQQRLNRLEANEIGVCGFSIVKANDAGEPVVGELRRNSVAMIRNPKMVVSYMPCGNGMPHVVGAFIASDAADDFLKKSEPPAHDKWDPDSQNLRDTESTGREMVIAVLGRVRAHLRKFQAEAAPPPPPKQKRLSYLERALGAYFKPQGKGPRGGAEGGASPLHLEFQHQPHAVPTHDGRLALEGQFSVRLDDKATDEQVRLKLTLDCPILEDDGREGDSLAVTVSAQDVDLEAVQNEESSYFFTLQKGAKPKFSVRSDPYERTWTVRFRPELEKVDED